MISGFLAIDKPEKISSFDVIRRLRRILKIKKMGHGGTLDPFATGILPIAIGEATKLLEFIANNDKAYEFTMKFGVATDTLDLEGSILGTNTIMPSNESLINILPQFLGKISQIPPKYSAIKINGQRAYDLARSGIDFEIKAREVEILDLQLLSYDAEKFEAKMYAKVSKGTYIRTLASDIAEKLGAICHLNYLRRVEFGKILEKDTISLDILEKMVNNGEHITKVFLHTTNILDDIPVFEVSVEELGKIRQGQFLQKSLNLPDSSIISLIHQEKIAAIAKYESGLIKPTKNIIF
ncbi:MAG: tRNA pseudouridine(55) synthase TruB [Alphaproteobacteria bacterium]|nr:tRNA pseudouridine(55) synthase TruB [Alphaproteobacteria bacterium]OJV13615.1 MAG: tRNA pseudouridine(55) synthase TruB [Alphaproteobacteria bacterium 33-17]